MSNDLAVELANRLKLPVDVVDGLLKIKMKNKFKINLPKRQRA